MKSLKRRFEEIKEWMEICEFLRLPENQFAEPYVCVPCKNCFLKDKSGKVYKIKFGITMAECLDIISQIKKVNAD